MNRSDHLKNVRRVVVKVGSSLLTDLKQGIDLAMVSKLASEIKELKKAGFEVILVSSGAIGLGMHRLKLKQRPRSIPEKQATAAVGQSLLMNHYERAFAPHGIPVAQVLLTRADLENRQRYLNARNTLENLLAMGALAVINENDTVAFEEIKFGENDNLAALVANLVHAELLVILSDVEGYFSENPRLNPGARLLTVVEKITDEMIAGAGGAGTAVGTGGMVTKLQAGRTVTASGEMMVIADGRKNNILNLILEGREEGTLFVAARGRMDAHSRWIAFTLKPKGALILDAGAALAVRTKGKSLLPSGLSRVVGKFEGGDPVRLLDPDEREIGRGLCNYSSQECGLLKGAKTSEIEQKLGYKIKDELVHRDDMVLSEEDQKA